MPLLALGAGTVAAQDALDRLVRAYPAFLAGHDASGLVWRDGTRQPLSSGSPPAGPDEQLLHGTLLDQLRAAYPRGAALPPGPGDDPGRVRNRAFFEAMYGDCRRGEVAPKLVPVVWLPRTWGKTLRMTAVNGAAAQLAAVSEELDALPVTVKRYLYPPAGTYNCRGVADLGQPSMHGWGAAIDINASATEYWRWRRPGHDGELPSPRPIPQEIVDAFERHGFIWGGKWSHYDTMHFEYRPELLGLVSPP